MLEHTMTLHRAYIHQTELHSLQSKQLMQTHAEQQARVHHSLVSQQHVDVDT